MTNANALARERRLHMQRELRYQVALANAFRADAHGCRLRGEHNNARLAEECAHAVELGNLRPLSSFRGLEYDR